MTVPEWGAAAREWSETGIDHVIEVGGSTTIEQSVAAAREGGHVSLIGILSGYKASVSTAHIMFKQLRILGITVGSHRHQRDMVAALEATGIRPIIDARRFGLEELTDAFRYQETVAHFGKIVVDYR